MDFLKRPSFRLGFILVLAVTIRVIGGLFSPAHPAKEPETVAWPTGSGGHAMIPKGAFDSSTLAAPLDDPLMQQALADAGRDLAIGEGDEAKMTFHSSRGPVTLTPTGLAVLNAEYRRLKARARSGTPD